MKNASRTSKERIGRAKKRRDSARAVELRKQRRRQYKLLAPPDVPHRRREARRWLDEFDVRITNPRVCERRPGERLFASIGERLAVADSLRDALRKADPELYRAVERLEFEDGARAFGITLAEWKARVARESTRISKVRAKMQRAGLI